MSDASRRDGAATPTPTAPSPSRAARRLRRFVQGDLASLRVRASAWP